jgi:hypothetical protein
MMERSIENFAPVSDDQQPTSVLKSTQASARQPLGPIAYIPRTGPKTPPITRIIRRLNAADGVSEGALVLKQHRSQLEQEQAAVRNCESSLQQRAVHSLVSGAIRAVATGRGECYQPPPSPAPPQAASKNSVSYMPRAGPTTPPIERTIRRMLQDDWASQPMQFEKHVSALEREKAEAPAQAAAARCQAQAASKLVIDALNNVCAAHGEVCRPSGVKQQVRHQLTNTSHCNVAGAKLTGSCPRATEHRLCNNTLLATCQTLGAKVCSH